MPRSSSPPVRPWRASPPSVPDASATSGDGAVTPSAGSSSSPAWRRCSWPGLRPGADGSADPAVAWLVSALLIPIGATLFGLLFITTLVAARRSLAARSPSAIVLVGAALVTLVLLLPLAGAGGAWLSGAADWTLAVPIGAVFRGLLIGVGLLTAVFAARIMLGIGVADD